MITSARCLKIAEQVSRVSLKNAGVCRPLNSVLHWGRRRKGQVWDFANAIMPVEPFRLLSAIDDIHYSALDYIFAHHRAGSLPTFNAN